MEALESVGWGQFAEGCMAQLIIIVLAWVFMPWWAAIIVTLIMLAE